MAKSKRQEFELECEVCGKRNYVASRNLTEHKEKMKYKKFCQKCRKRTLHKEKKIVYKKD